jgi:hypothetical protein
MCEMAKRKSTTATGIDAIIAIARTINPANVLATIAKTTGTFTTANRNVGRFTGRRVVAFQNWTMIENVRWQLDDVQLAFVWSVEFPSAVGRVFAMNTLTGVRPVPSAASIRDAVSIVRGVRSDWNRTGHGDPAGAPKIAAVSYGSRRFDVRGDESPTVTPKTVAPKTTVAPKPRLRKTA